MVRFINSDLFFTYFWNVATLLEQEAYKKGSAVTRIYIVLSDDDDGDDWEPTSPTLFILPLYPPTEQFRWKDRAT
jgi:hypothetical protein